MLSGDDGIKFDALALSGYDAVQNLLTHTFVAGTGAPGYDAAKAHQYYLNNRKLKGRKSTGKKLPVGRYKKVPVLKKRKSAAQLEKERAVIKARVAGLQARLAQLKIVLADLIKQAKTRSGIVTNTKTSTTTTGATTSTAALKTAAAKSSAAYYDKNKAQILAKAQKDAAANDPTALEQQIKDIQAKIEQARFDLAAAMKR